MRLTVGGARVTLGDLTLFNYYDVAVGSPIGWNSGDWTHIVSSFDGSRIRFYFQGRLIFNNVAAITNVFNTSTRCTIGTDEYVPGTYAYWLNASLDNVYYWNRALSDAEVYDVFQDVIARPRLSMFNPGFI